MADLIVKHPEHLGFRTAQTAVTVTDAAGTPLPGLEVKVAQRRHSFGFGNIGFDLIPLANHETEYERNVFGGATGNLERLGELYVELFNQTTLPFYWRGFEPHRGRPDTVRLKRTAEWFRERGVSVKGHPLLWHTLAPQWLLPLSDDEVHAEIVARIKREVRDFAGLIDQWDAINEAVILPVFTAEENAVTRLAKREGRVAMVKLAFDTARSVDPKAFLVLNDFDMTERYERLIEECLAGGVGISALGLQSHMHQGYWGEEKTLSVLERFARFGLPLQMTETTLLSGHLMPPEIEDLNDYQIPDWPSTPEGEERQADQVLRHYKTLFGHPSVTSITYWGITDDGSWLGAPSGFVRKDGSPKPAYEELKKLVKGEWWLPESPITTDSNGQFGIDAYLGDYTVSARGAVAEISVTPLQGEDVARGYGHVFARLS